MMMIIIILLLIIIITPAGGPRPAPGVRGSVSRCARESGTYVQTCIFVVLRAYPQNSLGRRGVRPALRRTFGKLPAAVPSPRLEYGMTA